MSYPTRAVCTLNYLHVKLRDTILFGTCSFQLTHIDRLLLCLLFTEII